MEAVDPSVLPHWRVFCTCQANPRIIGRMGIAHITVEWPDGSSTTGRSAAEVILRLAECQYTQTSFQDMKNQLSNRAQAWSGKYIEPYQGEQPFLAELFRVGLIKRMSIDGVDLERVQAQ